MTTPDRNQPDAAAMAADSRQQRAAHAAGQDRRSIGVTRKAFGR